MADKYRAIILMGPPGAGKGTVSSFLSLAGAAVHECLKAGRLIADEWVMELWLKHVQKMIAEGRYRPLEQDLLLDGVPRTLHQAQLLDQYVEVKQLILLEAADPAALWERIAHRKVKQGRADDQEAAFLERHAIYQRETQAVLTHYPASKVCKINALQRPLEVMRDILFKMTDLLCEGTSDFLKS
jgi:adenylate kinase